MSYNNDLISRSALLENIEKSRKAHASVRSRLTVGDMEQMIKSASAVDAVEVVRHGRWILNKHYGDYECSACGEGNFRVWDFKEHNMNYCPNCGAKMDGKECVPRKCGTCSNDGWDMPQCRECNEENGFKWYKRKMDVEVEE